MANWEKTPDNQYLTKGMLALWLEKVNDHYSTTIGYVDPQHPGHKLSDVMPRGTYLVFNILAAVPKVEAKLKAGYFTKGKLRKLEEVKKTMSGSVTQEQLLDVMDFLSQCNDSLYFDCREEMRTMVDAYYAQWKADQASS